MKKYYVSKNQFFQISHSVQTTLKRRCIVLCPNYISHLILTFRVKWKKKAVSKGNFEVDEKLKEYIDTCSK